MRTLAQIAKEDKKIASIYFNTPIIKTGKPYTPYIITGTRKKLGHKHNKSGKMVGEV